MAVGDLVTAAGQYEFNGLLLNDGPGGNIQVISTDGLFNLPDTKVQAYEMQDVDGGYYGPDLLTMRTITMDLAVRGSELQVQQKLDALKSAMQPVRALSGAADPLLVFWRPGILKRQIAVRPMKMGGFQSDFDMALGLAQGSLMFSAPDPRVTDFAQSSATMTILANNTSVSLSVNQLGYFRGGAWPVFSIAGPCTNPRITNNTLGRAIRIDLVINAGSTLVVDVKNRSVLLDGVDRYDAVRSDNQWWVLMPGTNSLNFTRSNAVGNTAVLTATWRSTYL